MINVKRIKSTNKITKIYHMTINIIYIYAHTLHTSISFLCRCAKPTFSSATNRMRFSSLVSFARFGAEKGSLPMTMA